MTLHFAQTMKEIHYTVVVRSCAFCGEVVDRDAATSLTLSVASPTGGVASLQAHASCFSKALHPYSRGAVPGAIEPTQ